MAALSTPVWNLQATPDRPTDVTRFAVLAFGWGLVIGCSSVAPEATQSTRAALPSTTIPAAGRTSSTDSAASDPIVDAGQLIGREWGLVGPLDEGISPATEQGIIGHLHTERTGDGHFVATLQGCFAGTFPVTFDGVHKLRIEAAGHDSVCANPFDKSSRLDELVSHSVSWRVTGSTLTLTDGGTIEFTFLDQATAGSDRTRRAQSTTPAVKVVELVVANGMVVES